MIETVKTEQENAKALQEDIDSVRRSNTATVTV